MLKVYIEFEFSSKARWWCFQVLGGGARQLGLIIKTINIKFAGLAWHFRQKPSFDLLVRNLNHLFCCPGSFLKEKKQPEGEELPLA